MSISLLLVFPPFFIPTRTEALWGQGFGFLSVLLSGLSPDVGEPSDYSWIVASAVNICKLSLPAFFVLILRLLFHSMGVWMNRTTYPCGSFCHVLYQTSNISDFEYFFEHFHHWMLRWHFINCKLFFKV